MPTRAVTRTTVASAVAKVAPLVLVVDDEPALRAFTESLLTAHGYQVVVAAHGKEAIQRLRECRPDLIVLDLNMPVMDGWSFRAEQRELTDRARAAVPVLIMTGEGYAAAHADGLRAVGVIQKPCDPEQLLDAVAAAMRLPTSARGECAR
jgi:CheY-like chemotaxis protein